MIILSLPLLPPFKLNLQLNTKTIEKFIPTDIDAIIEKKSGKIVRATDIFDVFVKKKRKKILPVGFIVAKNHIYLSTSNGRLLLIDFITGKTKTAYKIDNGKISRPIILGKNFYLAKDSSIIRLN